MSKLIELENKEDFKNTIKDGKVLVDFYAVWCGPCQMMKPVIEKYASDHDEVKVMSVDVDKFPDIASNYNVMSIPTFIMFKDGEPVGSKNGAMSAADLEKWVESY